MDYIDTSVLVAYYCPEAFSPAAQEAVLASRGPVISPLVEVELTSAVAMKVRTKDLDRAEAARILSLFHVHVADGYYRMAEIGRREYDLARDWLGRFTTALRTLDALHLAAAFANGLTLVTADKILAAAARRLGLKYKIVR